MSRAWAWHRFLALSSAVGSSAHAAHMTPEEKLSGAPEGGSCTTYDTWSMLLFCWR